jgi:hypothetical protein
MSRASSVASRHSSASLEGYLSDKGAIGSATADVNEILNNAHGKETRACACAHLVTNRMVMAMCSEISLLAVTRYYARER